MAAWQSGVGDLGACRSQKVMEYRPISSTRTRILETPTEMRRIRVSGLRFRQRPLIETIFAHGRLGRPLSDNSVYGQLFVPLVPLRLLARPSTASVRARSPALAPPSMYSRLKNVALISARVSSVARR